MSKNKAKTDNKTIIIPTLKTDLEGVSIPFDLFTGISLIVEEITAKEFKYDHLTNEGSVLITFNSPTERIIITVGKEDLTVRQFTMDEENRKLKVIYVVKPTERQFKLV